MTVNTAGALTLKAGQIRRMNHAIDRLSRVAIGRMRQRATIYRPSDTIGGDARLTESATTVASDVPCYINEYRATTEQVMDSAYDYQVAQMMGHFPLDTDLRRSDYITVDDKTYIVAGLVGGTGNLVEQIVQLRTALGDGDDVLT